MTAATDELRAVVRLRTVGLPELDPPQTEVVDRLRTLAENGSITELDVGIWDGPVGVTRADHRDPGDARESLADFEQWADEQGCTLRPAFERRSAGSSDGGEARIVTPLVTLAVYGDSEEDLRAVYPHRRGEDVRTIHDGLEALESMAGIEDVERTETEDSTVPLT